MILFQPCLVIGMQFFDGEGDGFPILQQGDALVVVGDVSCFKGFVSGGVLPLSGKKRGEGKNESGYQWDRAHLVKESTG